jgi:3-oxoacyl-[acyl-carrier protein] reductase
MATDLTLITGASSDIGVALIRHLLITTDRQIVAHSFSSNARIVDLQKEHPARIIAVQADLSDLSAITALADQLLALGEIAAVIHLPALPLLYDRFTKFKWDRFEQDFSIQVRSVALLLQRFLPKMSKKAGARIVFVLTSTVHGMPPKFTSMYTIVKYAQLGLMRCLAAEYAATNVRVNAISPSMVDTQFLSKLPEVAVKMAAESNPLGRNATPADLLGALDLLLSPASDYMNGVDIPIAAGTVV